jgi:hypothetical protein
MSVNPLPNNFRMPEPIFMKLGVYITAPEPISIAYFINPSHQSVCVLPYCFQAMALQNVAMATNTHATIEELLDE